MPKYYTDEKNAQVVLALLKEHGIRRVIASPGTTNMSIVASMQSDPFFEMYSSVDERSAAYMACGLAAETGEPVVISCTEATASRNYLPGLTEAFYRKLPVLAITSTRPISKIGHHIPQNIDRSSIPNDVAKLSQTLPIVKDDEDFWDCEIKVNRAILELKRNGGGPVHIEIPTIYSKKYETKELPKVRLIDRIVLLGNFPKLQKGRVAIIIGAHAKMSKNQTEAIDKFCASNNGVVFCDHTSNYRGKFRLLFSLASCQKLLDYSLIKPDTLVHIGEVSGDYYNQKIIGKEVWRVSEDGEIRDTFRKLRFVFEMPEQNFFEHYTLTAESSDNSYFQFCKNYLEDLNNNIPDLPFSNIWLASKMASKIPEGATILFSILNSLRSWNFFETPDSVFSASNVGGFGIDGGVSSLVGSSLANKDKLYFGVIGDLAFFYDMNVIGNRHVKNNLRILMINNAGGTEFRNYSHDAAHFGENTDAYIAAGGHFGNKSPELIRHYAQDLGFEYICASDKQEFEQVYERFLSTEISERPMFFEVFTASIDESEALEIIMNIDENVKSKVRQFAKQVYGKSGLSALKNAIKK